MKYFRSSFRNFLFYFLVALPLLSQERFKNTTPLTEAIRIEDFVETRRQINDDLVNKPDEGGYHPLVYAIYTKNLGLVRALLDAGANPNMVEENQKTPLYVAANLGELEIIKALHKAGATYPKEETRLPSVIAIQSGSIEVLELLRKLYPQIDLNDGWPWPKVSWEKSPGSADFFSFLCARSALIHSIASGSLEMTNYLVANGVELKETDSLGRTALHLAAWNPLCDEELIGTLVAKGLDPLKESFHHHFGPSTALDYAAASGSLEKVKAMTSRMDGRRNSEAIRRSAFVAAAYGHGDSMKFLFSFLGEEIPGVREVVSSGDLVKAAKADHAFTDLDPSTLNLPNLKIPRHLEKVEDGRVAIIASRDLRDLTALLEVEVSNLEEITLLERNSITPLVAEKLLGSFGKEITEDARNEFLNLDARQLLLLKKVQISSHQFIEASLVSTVTGMVEAKEDFQYPKQIDAPWVRKNFNGMIERLANVSSAPESRIAVSLTPLVANAPGTENLAVARIANIVMPTAISRTPGAVLLERNQLAHLELESAIGGRNDFWKAGWVIEGGVTLNSSGNLEISLAAKSVKSEQSIEVEASGQKEQVAKVLAKAWQKLASKLEIDDENQFKDLRSNREARQLAKEARWYLEAEYPRDAERLAEAAYLLGDRSELVLQTIVEAISAKLPAARERFCEHVRALPACLPPEKRLVAIYHFDRYFKLAQTSRDYLSVVNGPLTEGLPRLDSYNRVITEALQELIFYRTLIQDSLHSQTDQFRAVKLDLEIQELIEAYLIKIKGSELEAKTIAHILSNWSQYFEQSGKVSGDQMRKRTAELVENYDKVKPDQRFGIEFLIRRMGYVAGPMHGYYSPAWTSIEAARLLMSLPSGTRLPSKLQEDAKFSILPYLRKDRQRIELLEGIQESYDASSEARSIDYPLARSLGFHLGAEHSGSGNVVDAIESGFQHLILEPKGKFVSTGEYQRNQHSYRFLSYLAQAEPRKIERDLQTTVMALASKNEDMGKLKREDLAFLRKFLKDRGKLTEVAAEYLKIDDLPQDPKVKGETLVAEFLLELPDHEKLRGYSQYARISQAALDGEQLWLPTTYFKPNRSVSGVGNDFVNAVHVVNLETKKVDSVFFPKGSANQREFYAGSPRQRAMKDGDPSKVCRVFLGEKFSYFLGGFPEAILHRINKKTMEAEEVELPLPFVLAACAEVKDDQFYLSLTDKKSTGFPSREASKNMVVGIHSDGKIETVFSTHRRPSKTPFDRPGVMVDAFRREGDVLYMISNRMMGYADPKSFEGGIYHVKLKQWADLQDVKATQNSLNIQRIKFLKDFFGPTGFESGDAQRFFAHPYTGQSPFKKLVVANSLNSAAAFRGDRLEHPTNKTNYQLIAVEPTLPKNPRLFDRDLFQNRIENGSWTTPNDILNSGDYGVSVVTIWKDQVLVSIVNDQFAAPALWALDLEDIKELTE